MILAIQLALAAQEQSYALDSAKALLRKHQYDDVIELMTNFIDKQEKIIPEAHFIRGKAHYALMHLNDALEDLRIAVKKSKDGDIIASSNTKIFTICKNACNLDCDPEKYFFTEDQENLIKSRKDYKKQVFENDTNLRTKTAMMAENCSYDMPLIKYIFDESAKEGYFTGVQLAVAAYKKLFPKMKLDMYRAQLIADILKHSSMENWPMIQQKFHAVLPQDNDQVYWDLDKMAKLFSKAYAVAQMATGTANAKKDELQVYIDKLE